MTGYRLSKLRTERRIALDLVVESTGIPRETMLLYENDGVEPSGEDLELLATFYGVSVERLLGTDVDISGFHFSGGKPEPEALEDVRDSIRDIILNKYAGVSPFGRTCGVTKR
jgi:transcriptional regulator with XRE-family HTH domain